MAAASVKRLPAMLLLLLISASATAAATVGGTWCVARSDASDQALGTALEYACWAGADCAPLQPDGLCFLPNTFQAHASYAFNSFFQRSGKAAGACAFAGTATIADSDPSYGSCDYPSSPSTASELPAPGTETNPVTNSPTDTSILGNNGDAGLEPSTMEGSGSSTASMEVFLLLSTLLVLLLQPQPL